VTEINAHMRRRGTLVYLDDLTFELVARTKLHYSLLQIAAAISPIFDSATLHRLLRCWFQRFLTTTVPSFGRPPTDIPTGRPRCAIPVATYDGRNDAIMSHRHSHRLSGSARDADRSLNTHTQPRVKIEAEQLGSRAGEVRLLRASKARPETIPLTFFGSPYRASFSLLYRVEAEEMPAATRELGIALVAYGWAD
jgi:hypothetical protein